MEPKTATVTIRVPVSVKDDLELLAKATDRSSSSLAARAVTAWVSDNRWQIQTIEEGVRAADLNEVVSHEEVAAWLSSWGGSDEREPPK